MANTTIKIPTVGESITEVTIGEWLKKDGAFVKQDEVICELESDKASFELTAETDGILKIQAKEGDILAIGDIACYIEETKEEPILSDDTSTKKENEKKSTAEKTDENYASGHPSPAASKILAEKKISSKELQGSGKGGRITKEDALKVEKQSKEKIIIPPKELPTPYNPLFNRESERKTMSSIRRTIAKRLVSVKNETAMLTTFNEVNMEPILNIRKGHKEKFKEKYDVNLGFMSFFTKAVCLALKEWQVVNAQVKDNEIIYHHFCDIGIAVSTDRGLVVPIIRNAESLSFDRIEKEIVHLAVKARNNKLSVSEMNGGTFTITNGGIFGSMLSTPIINSPQSAILGMHNIVERPIVLNGEIVIKPIMYVALSYDHRIIDGKESVGFLVHVKELLEDPVRLLLQV